MSGVTESLIGPDYFVQKPAKSFDRIKKPSMSVLGLSKHLVNPNSANSAQNMPTAPVMDQQPPQPIQGQQAEPEHTHPEASSISLGMSSIRDEEVQGRQDFLDQLQADLLNISDNVVLYDQDPRTLKRDAPEQDVNSSVNEPPLQQPRVNNPEDLINFDADDLPKEGRLAAAPQHVALQWET
jgi:hypothetical protein